jgi:hypothetical protein
MSCTNFYECFDTLFVQPLIDANDNSNNESFDPTFFEKYRIMLIFAFISLISLLSIRNLKDLQYFNNFIKLLSLCSKNETQLVEVKPIKALKKSASVCPLGIKHCPKEKIHKQIEKFKKNAHLHLKMLAKKRRVLIKPMKSWNEPLKGEKVIQNHHQVAKCHSIVKKTFELNSLSKINSSKLDPSRETFEVCNKPTGHNLQLTFILSEDLSQKESDFLIVKTSQETLKESHSNIEFDTNQIHATVSSNDTKAFEIKLSDLKDLQKNICGDSNEREKDMLKMAILALLARETKKKFNQLKFSVSCKS